MVLTGKSKCMKENLLHCHFVNTNATWTDLGSNSVLFGEGDSYRLSRCTAELMLTSATESNPNPTFLLRKQKIYRRAVLIV